MKQKNKSNKNSLKKDILSKDNSFIVYLVIIFIIVQIIGIIVSNYYSKTGEVKGVITSDPNDIANALFIIGEILVFTGILLLLKRYFKSGDYLFVFEFLALFAGMVVVFQVYLPYLISIILAFVLLGIKSLLSNYINKFKKINLWFNNFLLGIAIAGAGSIIGLSLGILPVIVFLILLSIYDIIAVFYTKHMVVLAKMFIKKKIALTFSIPSKKKIYQLGGGDIVVPLVVSSSYLFLLLKHVSFNIAIIPIIGIWIASLLGLVWTFYVLQKGKVKVMPALPPQAILILIVIIISYVLLIA